jgi:hypothetical protein
LFEEGGEEVAEVEVGVGEVVGVELEDDCWHFLSTDEHRLTQIFEIGFQCAFAFRGALFCFIHFSFDGWVRRVCRHGSLWILLLAGAHLPSLTLRVLFCGLLSLAGAHEAVGDG